MVHHILAVPWLRLRHEQADIVYWDMLEVITIVESSHDLIDNY
jgi:hypothetical protein